MKSSPEPERSRATAGRGNRNRPETDDIQKSIPRKLPDSADEYDAAEGLSFLSPASTQRLLMSIRQSTLDSIFAGGQVTRGAPPAPFGRRPADPACLLAGGSHNGGSHLVEAHGGLVKFHAGQFDDDHNLIADLNHFAFQVLAGNQLEFGALACAVLQCLTDGAGTDSMPIGFRTK